MLWPNAHTRTRKRLSSYVDGQLSPRERTAVEAHLAGCDACRNEVDELRATISAVGGLASVEPPRSFALTPQVLERRGSASPAGVPAFANGMRLAGAAIAFLLAVVLVGDFASMSGDNSGSDDAGMQRTTEIQMSELDNRDAGAPYAAPAATGAAERDAFIGEDEAQPEDLSAAAGALESCPIAAGGDEQSTDSGDAGGAGGPQTGAQDATPMAEPAPPVSLVPAPEEAGTTVECAPATAGSVPQETSPVVANSLRDDGDEDSASAAESLADNDGGVSTITVIEIILAGGLVALIGAIGLELVLRRRAT